MEAQSGDFVYRDAFFVEVSKGKRHPRASTTELRDLLLPKKNNLPPKDQVAHWYKAQLVHYGLPRTKDKNTAKIRLLSAVNDGSLKVPESVRKIETQLKKEFASIQRKAKAGPMSSTDNERAAAQYGQKRKAMDEGSLTLSFPHGSTSFTFEQHNSSSKSSTPKAQKSFCASSPRSAKRPGKAQSVKPQMATSTTRYKPSSRPKKMARRSTPPAQPMDDDPPPPYYGIGDDDHEEYTSDMGSYVQVSGIYDNSSSTHSVDGYLSLRLVNDQDQLWGRFRLGSKSGVIRMDHLAGLGEGATKSFGWRSEDKETGALKFGKGCDGWIRFDGRGGLTGSFYNLIYGEDVEFEGEIYEPFEYGHDVERKDAIMGMEMEWHDFPERAYGRK